MFLIVLIIAQEKSIVNMEKSFISPHICRDTIAAVREGIITPDFEVIEDRVSLIDPSVAVFIKLGQLLETVVGFPML
jgi:hypothetical protein